MGKKRTVEEMADALYHDDEVKAAVIADVEKHGTRSLIESGQSVLPTNDNATHWHARITGKLGKSPRELALEQITKSQDERLAALEEKLSKLTEQPKKDK